MLFCDRICTNVWDGVDQYSLIGNIFRPKRNRTHNDKNA